MLRKILAVAVALACFSLLPNAPFVSAHAEYDHSTPGDGEKVTTPPTQVDVYFSEELLFGGANELNVLGPGNIDYDNNDSTVEGVGSDHMFITLQGGLPYGVYTVEWHSHAEDGDEEEGSFQFTISPPSVGGVGFDVGDSDSGVNMGLVAGSLATAVLAASALLGATLYLARRR